MYSRSSKSVLSLGTVVSLTSKLNRNLLRGSGFSSILYYKKINHNVLLNTQVNSFENLLKLKYSNYNRFSTYISPCKESENDVTEFKLSNEEIKRLSKLRNIGISAHIDSGKTTLTERILFYTGRIEAIHEVRGKDDVGATMDSMDLEKERGITIQSAATYTHWKDTAINIIDTPGHVDFTVEVERALRVLDSAVLVLCAVGGVQSQTVTVDRQMRRYEIPRICFINKLDRQGANPWKVISQIREKLKLNVAAVEIPIGSEKNLEGVVDLVEMRAIYNKGEFGEIIEYGEIPNDIKDFAIEKRQELIEKLADADDEIADLFIMEEDPTNEQLKTAIRRATIARHFVPVFMGSAYHNRGIQPLLDGVIDYLPCPNDVINKALDVNNEEKEVILSPSKDENLVALAFKLEESRFGQLTYLRIYQGDLRKGDTVFNVRTGKKQKVPRLVRMHSNNMEDVQSVPSGEICAMFGLDCASGDSFTDGKSKYALSSIYVPDAVVSLSLHLKGKETPNFSKGLQRFQREDPTFRVHMDPESKETIISGMGELHLEIYVERLKREYNTECLTGKPQVAYKEAITEKIPFSYTHKKQSGGAGQYAKIEGYIEPVEGDIKENIFENKTVGTNIPSNFIPAIEKGFFEACGKGPMIGSKVSGLRMVLLDGGAHAVDSSELAFRLCTLYAFNEAFKKAGPQVLQPIMDVDLTAPIEFQGPCVALINKRKGTITDTVVKEDAVDCDAEVALNDMFGFSAELRSLTQGKGEFSMEYLDHRPVTAAMQADLVAQSLERARK